MLNSDQQNALIFIRKWWRSQDLYMVLDGAGGTGKSYLIDEAVSGLNCSPMLLCPTHEALKQLQEKVKGDYTFRTIHSALGIAPTTGQEHITFEQVALPKFWDDHNLIIVDESSMIDNDILDILLATKKKIIFVGHAAQLPPVDSDRGIFDLCISPVFIRGFPTVTLTIPMRNTGDLWDFNNHLCDMIYSKDKQVPKTFDITKSQLDKTLSSTEGIKALFAGSLKIAMWSNKGVDLMNQRVREILFGAQAKNHRYMPGDKILITKPLTVIHSLDNCVDSALRKVMNSSDLLKLYANTKAEVLDCSIVTVKLNKHHVTCFKLKVVAEDYPDDVLEFYEPLHSDDLDELSAYYRSIAFSKKAIKEKQNAFKYGHFALSLFARIKHCYAMTSHRLQGSTIDSVIVMLSDIQKNQNMIEQKKCLYVACSRAKNNLMVYRGL